MDSTEYIDFDLMIERSGEKGYRARLLSSPAGQATKDLTLPFSDIELENFLLRIGRPRRGVRRLESPEMEYAKQFGGKLFKSIFDEDMLSALRRSLDEVKKQNKGLRIRLRLNDAPELVNLPWEYLYNSSSNSFLSLSVTTPVVRYLELSERITPLTVKLPLRVLVMISSPTNYPALDVEREWSNLKKAVSGLEDRGLLTLKRLEAATPAALQYELRRGEYHVFHFIGHGGFDEQAQDGILLFEDENHNGQTQSGQVLGFLLHDEQTLRLTVLNACEGGRSGANDPFAGVAQSLVQQGLSAVIAMQFEITDEAAITFAREFYTAISEGLPVDAAMSEARKAILFQGNDIEWGTPVLYMRAEDGRIFDVDKRASRERPSAKQPSQAPAVPQSQPQASVSQPTRSTPAKSTPDLESVYTDGLSAYWLQDWACAEQYFAQIVQVDPNYKDVAAKLAEARQHMQITTLNEQAQQAAAGGNWEAAVVAIEKLVQLQPADAQLAARLEQAKQEVSLAALYTQAKELYQAKQWQAVINILGKIHAIRPEFADPENLLSGAQGAVAEAQRQAKLISLYNQALKSVETSNWQEAASLFDQVQKLDANYRDTVQYVARIRARLEAEAIKRQAVTAQSMQAQSKPVILPTKVAEIQGVQVTQSVQAEVRSKAVNIARMPGVAAPVRQKPAKAVPEGYTGKSWSVTFLLCSLFGLLGAHRFYSGHWKKGLLYLFTLGLVGIGWLVDMFKLVTGSFRDPYGLPLNNRTSRWGKSVLFFGLFYSAAFIYMFVYAYYYYILENIVIAIIVGSIAFAARYFTIKEKKPDVAPNV